jgi:putative ABC transport system permease protein
MPLWKIAWRSVQRRALASSLTALSMALGVALVVAVLLIHGVVAESFRSNSSLGYDMIIGAKGGRLQLVLNTVYYLSQPVENLPLEFYREFLPAGQRPDNRDGRYLAYIERVVPVCLGDYYLNYRVVGTTPELFDFVYDARRQRGYQFAAGRNLQLNSPQFGNREAVLGAKVARDTGLQVGDTIQPSHGSPEGHAHDDFHVVGILQPSGTPNDRAVFISMEGFNSIRDHLRETEFAATAESPVAKSDDGQMASWVDPETDTIHWSRRHDFRRDDVVQYLAVGNPVLPGLADERYYHVILDGEDAIALAASREDALAGRRVDLREAGQGRHKLSRKEVTALLVDTRGPFHNAHLRTVVNEGLQAQAVLPIAEIYALFDLIVKPIQSLLLVISAMICVVSGVSILVSIYNSMSDRRHEIAVMRSLGAGRQTVMTIVLLEAVILALAGGLLGWVAGHGLIAAAGPAIESRTGVAISPLDFAPPLDLGYLLGADLGFKISSELLLVPSLIVLAIVVGFLPALAAYRTDVAKALSAAP